MQGWSSIVDVILIYFLAVKCMALGVLPFQPLASVDQRDDGGT